MDTIKIMVTGHRPDKLGGYEDNPIAGWVQQRLKEQLIAAVESYEQVIMVSGMALGVDTIWAELAKLYDIPLIAAVPFVGQWTKWGYDSQQHYFDLIAYANLSESRGGGVVTISQGGYSAPKMQLRNEWMVDHANLIIAVWNGSSGGTANCVRYALNRGREADIIRIDPTNFITLNSQT